MTKTAIQQRQHNFDVATALIRAALSGEYDPDALRAKCADADFREVRRALQVHGMLRICTPLIAGLEVFSADQVEKLRRRGRQTTSNRLRILALGRRVTGLLDAAEIRHLHLKGFGLSQRLFADPAARNFTDIDLLISPVDMMAADRLLKAEGFLPANDLARMSKAQRGVFSRLQHDVAYTDPQQGISVEVHWRFNRSRPVTADQFDHLYARREMVEIGGWQVPSLALDDEAAYLVDHGVKHGWLRLKWLHDIHALNLRFGISIFDGIGRVPGLGVGMGDVQTAIALCEDFFAGKTGGTDKVVTGFRHMIAAQDLHLPLGGDPDVALQLLRNKSLRDRLYGLLPSIMNTYAWGVQSPPLGWWPMFVFTGPLSWLRRKGMLGEPRIDPH